MSLKPDEQQELMRKICSTPFKFWCCSNPEHKCVRWDGDVAICEECGEKSTEE